MLDGAATAFGAKHGVGCGSAEFHVGSEEPVDGVRFALPGACREGEGVGQARYGLRGGRPKDVA